VTGKFYVGMHSTDDIDDGYLGSGKILGYSRAKYGDENHKKEILEFLPDRTALKLREKEIVNEELLAHPLNINLKYGGEGGFDHILKTRANLKSEKFIVYRNSGALVANLLAGSKNRTREQYSKGAKKAWASSRDSMIKASMVGIRAMASEDANRKRRDTLQNIGHARGEKNSQFGTCWVTDGKKPIKVKKEQLGEYLSKGFTRGRKYMQG
jgi:hypothetical protein